MMVVKLKTREQKMDFRSDSAGVAKSEVEDVYPHKKPEGMLCYRWVAAHERS